MMQSTWGLVVSYTFQHLAASGTSGLLHRASGQGRPNRKQDPLPTMRLNMMQ